MHARTHASTHVHTHAHAHIHKRARTHACMHTCMHGLSCAQVLGIVVFYDRQGSTRLSTESLLLAERCSQQNSKIHEFLYLSSLAPWCENGRCWCTCVVQSSFLQTIRSQPHSATYLLYYTMFKQFVRLSDNHCPLISWELKVCILSNWLQQRQRLPQSDFAKQKRA